MSSPHPERAAAPSAPAGSTATTALVLAGGLGSRLRPVVGNLPKVLAPIAGQPFLSYLLAYLRGQGIADILLSTGYGAEHVSDYCRDGSRWGVRVRYSREAEPLGTGGAIKRAEGLITSDPCLVLNGDSLVRADLARLLAAHAERQARITMALVEVPDKARFGSVLQADGGAIAAFREKGDQGSGLINAGIYVIDRAVLDAIPVGYNVSVERDVFPSFVGKGLYGLVVDAPFIDIGTPEAYAAAQTIAAGWAGKARHDTAGLVGP